MDSNTVLLFTRYGMGDAPQELQGLLAGKFLSLIDDAGVHPAKVLFYADGVELACEGSSVLEQLRALSSNGVELILCQTCLDYYGLRERVAVGIVGSMPDIIEAMSTAGKVIGL